MKDKIFVTNFDAKMWGMAESNKYMGILLDAPCTSERHSLKSKREIEKWSLKKVESNSQIQFSLLKSALQACKIGGHVIYSTCALSDIENDGVVSKVLKSFQKTNKQNKGKPENIVGVVVEDIKCSVGEKTTFGWRILPDKTKLGEGPLYVCKIKRTY